MLEEFFLYRGDFGSVELILIFIISLFCFFRCCHGKMCTFCRMENATVSNNQDFMNTHAFG